MKRSIHARLILGTATAVGLIFAISGGVIYVLVRAALIREFDEAGTAKAKALATMVERNHDGSVRFELDPAQMPEFTRPERPEYFQCFDPDGRTLVRSASLNGGDLLSSAAVSLLPQSSALLLPDQRRGRQATIQFRAAPEDDADARIAATYAPLLMTVARSTENLDSMLDRILGLLGCVCAGAILTSSLVLKRVVQQGLGPVKLVASQIAAIEDSNLSGRIETARVPHELEPIVQRLNELLTRLEAAFIRERSFTADVAHELRTPLAGLRTSLEVCASRPRAPKEYELTVNRCLQVTHQMHAMVDNLMAVARVDAGQLKLFCEPVAIQRLLDECWSLFAGRAAQRGLRVEWNVKPGCVISTDREKLRLVLQNLLDNAVSYANENGTIRITGDILHRQIQLKFANTGNRLTCEQIELVFDRFWRGDAARSQTGVHCGLGLTFVRRVIELMGGSISVHAIQDGWFEATMTLAADTAVQQGAPAPQVSRRESVAT